ncbi:type II CAAX endopeptidase family protein [Bacillus sp. H1a]|uniref:CPBP family intramembrane glutamic endopeptidase n=1 Tax=Bacillus sp. H1a TaxID=1397276 RepID=UPI00046A96D7|nr:type II CAAX endopeptidase family protein [Bacillus sp. H1a]
MNKSYILQNNKMNKHFLLYIVLFYSLWLLKEYWVGYIVSYNSALSIFLSSFFKILIWVVPAWLYITFYLQNNFKEYTKLNKNIKKGLKWGIALSLLLGISFTIKIYLIKESSFFISPNLNQYINSFLLAGLTEEIVYRGLILNQLQKKFNFWKSNIITSILFLIIHYPTWLNNQEFLNLYNHLYIILFSLFLGYIYKKTNSLWTVIIVHSVHNLFIIIS